MTILNSNPGKKIGAKEISLRGETSGSRFLPFYLLFPIIFCILFILSQATTANAQNSDDVIRVETELVTFEVTVTDQKGNPVRGLEAKDFRLFEDGQKRSIDFFAPLAKKDARPLSIVFALDISGSMTVEELTRLRDSLQKFVERLADYNSYFSVMTFGMEIKTVQSFTNRRERLEKSFDKILRDQNGLSTHAYDAVDNAIRALKKKSPSEINNQPPKRAVILITDGFPVGDTVAPKTVIERANDAETSVYAVLLPSFSRFQFGKKPLLTPLEASGLIEKTGGRSFYADSRDFESLFNSLAEEITSSYAVAFYPDNKTGQNGKFHDVRIETTAGLKITQNRAGYRSP